MPTLLMLVAVLAAVALFWRLIPVRIKRGVLLNVAPEIMYAIGVADQIYLAHTGAVSTITSARDQHEDRPESLHNVGRAIDLRTRDLTRAQRDAVYFELHRVLYPQGFDVVLESDHIHIEYDPKVAQSRVFTGEVVV